MRAAIPEEALYGRSWGKAYNKTEHILRLANDAEIYFRSMKEADAVRPLSVDGLIAEEFSYWTPYAWNECVRPTLMARDAPALFIFTPAGMNQAYEIWDRYVHGENGYTGFHFTSFDGTIPKEIIDAEFPPPPKTNDAVYRQEILAEFLAELGGVFSGVIDCVAGAKERPEQGRRYIVAADLGKYQDPTVIIVGDRERGHVVEFDRFLEVDWRTQRQRLVSYSKQYNDAVIWIDSTGVGDAPYDELVAEQAPVKGYKITSTTKPNLIEALRIAIVEGRITFPEIPELISELRIFQAKRTEAGNIRYSAPQGYHDDCVIALALFVWAMRGSTITDFRPVFGRERMRLPSGPF